MISVIIPSYNYGHLIADTINSVISQTYTDWEMIIVDDGSKDNTAEVVKGYVNKDPRISYYEQPNAGPSAARNKAISLAKGDFIQFLDADDLLEKKKFEVQLRLFKENPHAGIVYSSVRYFTRDPFDPADRHFTYWGSDKEWMPKLTGYGLDILPDTLKGNIAHVSSLLFRKKVVDEAGPWDVEKRAAEDYLFLLKCAMNNAFFLYHDTPDTWSLVRWHPDNASRDTDWIREGEKKMRIELIPVLDKINNKAAIENNNNAIKALSLMVKKSWKKKFLSGGPFDFLKKGLKAVGLDRIARKIFYK
jgi:glycosyltransferase involved in cell wall biosynthesis